jgi:hypothetical protein
MPAPIRRGDPRTSAIEDDAMGRTLVFVGLGIAALGLLMMWGVPFGRLPGDIQVRRGNFSFYFPLATSIVLSILLTLILSLFRK